MFAHACTRAAVWQAAWTLQCGRLLLATGLALIATACAPAPPPPLAGPDPADPNVPVPPTAYRSPVPAAAPRRPVEPSAWQGEGDRTTPAAKP
jgi:hypothetical protein